MHPTEAVRQLEDVIDASVDQTGHRAAAGYRPTFERVADHADGDAVYAVACSLASEVVAGDCPSPAEANAVAEEVISDWAYTDGGE